MAKRKLTVTHNGQTFTRTTERTYTHAILVRSDYERDRAHAIVEAARTAHLNYPYYVSEANPATRKHHDRAAKTLARYVEIAAMSADQYAQQAGEQAAAAIDAKRAAGDYDRFGVLEWCGRNDLAHNALGKARQRGWAEVVLVEVPPAA